MKIMFSNRIRFNWGFHDATGDRQDGRANRMNGSENPRYPLPAHDKAYCVGYAYGQKADMPGNVQPATSDGAWKEHSQE